MKRTITLNVHITFELINSPALDSDTRDYLAGIASDNVKAIINDDFKACDIDNIRVTDVAHDWSKETEIRSRW